MHQIKQRPSIEWPLNSISVDVSVSKSLNPLSPKCDQHEFSPNDIQYNFKRLGYEN